MYITFSWDTDNVKHALTRVTYVRTLKFENLTETSAYCLFLLLLVSSSVLVAHVLKLMCKTHVFRLRLTNSSTHSILTIHTVFYLLKFADTG